MSNETRALSRWNKYYFGYADKNITRLEDELKNIQSTDKGKSQKHEQILDALCIQRARQESIWRQKSRKLLLK